MILLVLEALGALFLLLLIVWWTMFSGRKSGELPAQAEPEPGKGEGPRQTGLSPGLVRALGAHLGN